MYLHDQLMRTRHDDRLRTAARRRLAAEARHTGRTATIRPRGRTRWQEWRLRPAWAGTMTFAGLRAGPNEAGEP